MVLSSVACSPSPVSNSTCSAFALGLSKQYNGPHALPAPQQQDQPPDLTHKLLPRRTVSKVSSLSQTSRS